MNDHTYSEKLNDVLNNLFHGVLLMNEQGRILEFNEASLKILGKSKEELNQLSIQDFIAAPYQEDFQEYFKNCLSLGIKNYSKFEVDYVYNETELLLEIDCNQNFTSEKDNQLYVIGVLTDITQRGKLKQELDRQKKSKQLILERLEREEELNDLKTKFISIASHEFRTPLAGILSSVDLIDRYLTTDTEMWSGFKYRGKLESHMKKIQTSVKTLNAVLNQILSIETLKEGRIEYEEEEFNLEELLKSLVDEFDHLKKKEQNIHFEFLSKENSVVLDKNILKNVMIFLLSNAVKYTPEGKNIFVSACIGLSNIEIEIKDEGIGIPKAGQKYMFKRFFKAKNAKNREGIGLGLNLALRYVHLMNGEITFDSEENKGTTFKVCFEKEVATNKELEWNEKDIIDRG